MAITASLQGRVKNTSLPKSHALLPLFEAVVNSIDSTDAAHGGDMNSAKITIHVERERPEYPTEQLHAVPYSGSLNVRGFTIIDNGEGFNDSNLRSFRTLDSQLKENRGGRGVGRIVWLKAFERVEVSSVHIDPMGQSRSREFEFTLLGGVSKPADEITSVKSTGATVKLIGFKSGYRTTAPRSLNTIAKNIFEHCLWYFIRDGGSPTIILTDDEESINLNSVYDNYMHSMRPDCIEFKGHKFEFIHLKLKAGARSQPQLAWCADQRVVFEENLSNRIPGLSGKLSDSDGDFVYSCYVTSPYLNDNVRSDRTGFDLLESANDGLVLDLVSKQEIRQLALESAEKFLGRSLAAAREKIHARVRNYVDHKAPRYRPILQGLDFTGLTIGPEVNDRELEAQLHKKLYELEAEILREGHEVLDFNARKEPGYQEKLNEYLLAVEALKKSDLAAYVFRRHTVLELLGRAIEVNESGNYGKEEEIHKLIMPMRTDSNRIDPEASNLWIIDERLAFHNYLASDLPIGAMPISSSTSTTEPDIIALKIAETRHIVTEANSPILPSIVIVEIKRPMRRDMSARPEKDPISQSLNYLKRIREGVVKNSSGRALIAGDGVPGFIYILADLTSQMIERCEDMDLIQSQDRLSFFGYHATRRAYIEVISFEGLIKSAQERNRAFFDKLGLPNR